MSNTGRREYTRHIEALLDASAWTSARWVAREELLHSPDDHWLWAQIALTYAEDGAFTEAVEAISRAALLAPKCPMVLWYRGVILTRRSDADRAAFALRALLDLPREDVVEGDCGLGGMRAGRLLRDAARTLAHVELRKDPSALLTRVRRWTRTSPAPNAVPEITTH